MIKWEYKTSRFKNPVNLERLGAAQLVDMAVDKWLNSLGSEGWELVMWVPTGEESIGLFKRQLGYAM